MLQGIRAGTVEVGFVIRRQEIKAEIDRLKKEFERNPIGANFGNLDDFCRQMKINKDCWDDLRRHVKNNPVEYNTDSLKSAKKEFYALKEELKKNTYHSISVNAESINAARVELKNIRDTLADLQKTSANINISSQVNHAVDATRAATQISQAFEKSSTIIEKSIEKSFKSVMPKGGGLKSLLSLPFRLPFRIAQDTLTGVGYDLGRRVTRGISAPFDDALSQFGGRAEQFARQRANRYAVYASRAAGFRNTRDARDAATQAVNAVDFFYDPGRQSRTIKTAEKRFSKAAQDAVTGKASFIDALAEQYEEEIQKIKDITFGALGQATQPGRSVASIGLRINKDIQIARQANRIDEFSKNVKVDPQVLERAQKTGNLVIISPGLQQMEGRGATELMGQLRQFTPNAAIVPGHNYAMDSSKPNFRRLQRAYDRSIGKFIPADIDNNLQAFGLLGGRMTRGAGRSLENQLLGSNDALRQAAIAKAYKDAGFEGNTSFFGYSAGVADAQEATRISERAGIQNVQGLGVGGVVTGLGLRPQRNFTQFQGGRDWTSLAMRGDFQKIFANRDRNPELIDSLHSVVGWIPDAFLRSASPGAARGTNFLPNAGAGHGFTEYLSDPQFQSRLNPRLGFGKNSTFTGFKGNAALKAENDLRSAFTSDLFPDASPDIFRQLNSKGGIYNELIDHAKRNQKFARGRSKTEYGQVLDQLTSVQDAIDSGSDEAILSALSKARSIQTQRQQGFIRNPIVSDYKVINGVSPLSPQKIPTGRNYQVFDQGATIEPNLRFPEPTKFEIIQRETEKITVPVVEFAGGIIEAGRKTREFTDAIVEAGRAVRRLEDRVTGGKAAEMRSAALDRLKNNWGVTYQPYNPNQIGSGNSLLTKAGNAARGVYSGLQKGEQLAFDTAGLVLPQWVLSTTKKAIQYGGTFAAANALLPGVGGAILHGGGALGGLAGSAGGSAVTGFLTNALGGLWGGGSIAGALGSAATNTLVGAGTTIGAGAAGLLSARGVMNVGGKVFDTVFPGSSSQAQLPFSNKAKQIGSAVQNYLEPAQNAQVDLVLPPAQGLGEQNKELSEMLDSLNKIRQVLPALQENYGLSISRVKSGNYELSDLIDTANAGLGSRKILDQTRYVQSFLYDKGFEQQFSDARPLQQKTGRFRKQAFGALSESLPQIQEAARAGDDTAQGFLDAFYKSVPEMKSLADKSGKEFIAALKEALGVRSPSWITALIAKDVVEGFLMQGEEGISELEMLASKMGIKFTEEMRDSLRVNTPEVQKAFSELLAGDFTAQNRLPDSIKDRFKTTPLRKLKSEIDDLSNIRPVDPKRSIEIQGKRFGENVRDSLNDAAKSFSDTIEETGILEKLENALGLGRSGVGAFFSGLSDGLPTKSLIGAGVGAIALPQIARVGNELSNVTLEQNRIERGLSAVVGTEADDFYSRLSDQASELGVSLQSSADAAINLEATFRNTALEGQSLDVLQGFQETIRDFGLGAQEQDSIFRGVAKSARQGKIQLDEFNLIVENMPGTFQALANAYGVTTAEITRMITAGELLSEDALPKLSRELQANSLGAVDSANVSFSKFNNNLFQIQASLGETPLAIKKSGFDILNLLMGDLAKEGNITLDIIKALVAAITIGLVGATGAAIVSLGKLAVATSAAKAVLAGIGAVSAPILGISAAIGAATLAWNIYQKEQAKIAAPKALKEIKNDLDGIMTRLEEIRGISDLGIDKKGFDLPFGLKFGGSSPETEKFISDVEQQRKANNFGKEFEGRIEELSRAISFTTEGVSEISAETVKSQKQQTDKINGDIAKFRAELAAQQAIGDSDGASRTRERITELQRELNNTSESSSINKIRSESEKIAENYETLQNEILEAIELGPRFAKKLNPLVTQLDSAKKDIDSLNKKFSELDITPPTNFTRVAAELENSLLAIDRAQTNSNRSSQRREQQLLQSAGLGTLGQQSLDRSLQNENVNRLKRDIESDQKRLDTINERLESLSDKDIVAVTEQLKLLNTNLDDASDQDVGTALNRLAENGDPLSDGAKALFGNVGQRNAIRDRLQDSQTQLSRAQRDQAQSQIDLANSQTDFIRQVAETNKNIARSIRDNATQLKRQYQDINVANHQINQEIKDLKRTAGIRESIRASAGTFAQSFEESIVSFFDLVNQQVKNEFDRQASVLNLNRSLEDLALGQRDFAAGLRSQQRGLEDLQADRQGMARGQIGKSGLVNPVQGIWNAEGGYDADSGLDLIVPEGTNAIAAASGELVYAERGHSAWMHEDAAKTVPGFQEQHSALIKLDQPFESSGKIIEYIWYTHLYEIEESIRNKGTDRGRPTRIEAGQVLGKIGTANNVPHLHFGLLSDRRQRHEGDWLGHKQVRDILYGSGGGVNVGSTRQPSQGISGSVDIDMLREAIIGKESNNNPRAVNPHSGALGLGQVMPENVAEWTRQALGRSLSPDQFLYDTDAQLATINHQLKGNLEKALKQSGGNTEEAIRRVASIWYSGRSDLFNDPTPQTYGAGSYPSIGDYTRDVFNRYSSSSPSNRVSGVSSSSSPLSIPQINIPSTAEEQAQIRRQTEVQKRLLLSRRNALNRTNDEDARRLLENVSIDAITRSGQLRLQSSQRLQENELRLLQNFGQSDLSGLLGQRKQAQFDQGNQAETIRQETITLQREVEQLDRGLETLEEKLSATPDKFKDGIREAITNVKGVRDEFAKLIEANEETLKSLTDVDQIRIIDRQIERSFIQREKSIESLINNSQSLLSDGDPFGAAQLAQELNQISTQFDQTRLVNSQEQEDLEEQIMLLKEWADLQESGDPEYAEKLRKQATTLEEAAQKLKIASESLDPAAEGRILDARRRTREYENRKELNKYENQAYGVNLDIQELESQRFDNRFGARRNARNQAEIDILRRNEQYRQQLEDLRNERDRLEDLRTDFNVIETDESINNIDKLTEALEKQRDALNELSVESIPTFAQLAREGLATSAGTAVTTFTSELERTGDVFKSLGRAADAFFENLASRVIDFVADQATQGLFDLLGGVGSSKKKQNSGLDIGGVVGSLVGIGSSVTGGVPVFSSGGMVKNYMQGGSATLGKEMYRAMMREKMQSGMNPVPLVAHEGEGILNLKGMAGVGGAYGLDQLNRGFKIPTFSTGGLVQAPNTPKFRNAQQSQPDQINIKMETQVINNQEYLTVEEGKKLAQSAANQGQELALRKIRGSVNARKSLRLS